MDYPTIGPQHAALYETGRATHTRASDEEALPAFKLLGRTKAIIPVLESSHALAYLITHGKKYLLRTIVLFLIYRDEAIKI